MPKAIKTRLWRLEEFLRKRSLVNSFIRHIRCLALFTKQVILEQLLPEPLVLRQNFSAGLLSDSWKEEEAWVLNCPPTPPPSCPKKPKMTKNRFVVLWAAGPITSLLCFSVPYSVAVMS